MPDSKERPRAHPLKAAIIGCGRVGSFCDEKASGPPETHAGTMMRDSRVELVALVDINEDRRRVAQQCWGVAAAYADYQQLFADQTPDLISICTPTDTHAEILLAAIQAGVKGIWTEKPLASTRKEADRVLQAVERSGVNVVLNYTRRYSCLYQQLRQDLADGMIGEVVRAHVLYARGLANNGGHAIDISRFLFGDIAKVWGEDFLHESSHDPSVDAWLVTKSGVGIYLQALPGMKYDIFEIRIFGTLGRVDLVDQGRVPVIFKRASAARCVTGYSLQIQARSYPRGIEDAWPRALSNLLAVCQGSARPICSARDGWETMRMIEAIRQSAQGSARGICLE